MAFRCAWRLRNTNGIVETVKRIAPVFGGINGKSGSRVMQIGLRVFF